MTAGPSSQQTLGLDQLAQLVETHGFRVTVLGTRMFSAEKYTGRGRIRMVTVRWNGAQNAWTGKLQTLEHDVATPRHWRPSDRHPGVSVLQDFAGARDWLAKVEQQQADS